MVVTSPWETALFCYAIINVDPDADDETINEAYLRLAALKHPRGHGVPDAASTEFYRLLQAHHALESDSARIRQTLDDLAARVARASCDFLFQIQQLEDTKAACRAEFAALSTEVEAGNPRLNDYISLLAASRRDGRPAARGRRRAHRDRRVCGGHKKEVNRVEAGNEAARRAVHAQWMLMREARQELAVGNARLARVRRERNGRFRGGGKAGVEMKKGEEGGVEVRNGGSDDGKTDDAVKGYRKCVSWEEQRRAWLVDDLSSLEQLQNGEFGDMVRVI